jgi:phage terminase large subunit-like protein
MGPYRKLSPDAIPEVAEWLHIVEGGVIPVSKDNHQLCALVRKIFSEEELWLDRKRLDTYLGYQQYFPFRLNAPEKFMLALMLCVYMLPGIPRFETLFLYVGRGFGKNGFITFLVFCMLSKANGILEYDVHVAATTEDQAKTSFEELRNLLDRGKSKFENGFSWTKTEIKNKSTSSVFKFLTANAASKDGGRPGALILDEIHAYENSKLIAVLIGGLGKKDDARIFKITTDGDVREGPLDEEKEKAERILAQEIPDRRTLPMLFRLDDPEEIHDESMWPKANPAILERPNLLQRYREDYQDWLEHPQKHPEVPTKRFNCPQQRADLALTTRENLMAASRDLGELEGLPCVLGIDYARTTDMVGACLLFHRDGEWQAVHHGWWCTHSADAGEVKAPLDQWAEQGLLTIVDDVDISPALPCEWARDWTAARGCTIEMAALDDYRLALMKGQLKEVLDLDSSLKGEDQQVYVVRPSDQMRVYPVLDSVLANHQIAWGDSPLMRWCANNVKVEPAPDENFKYGKMAPHSRKTDVFMALVAAFSVRERIPEEAELVFGLPVFY